MRDPRVGKLAKVLVNYSIGVRSGDVVRINGSVVCEPLVFEVFREVLAAGGHPEVRLTADSCQESLLRYGSDEQLKYVSPLQVHEVETIDCAVNITGSENVRALSGIEPARQRLVAAARKPH